MFLWIISCILSLYNSQTCPIQLPLLDSLPSKTTKQSISSFNSPFIQSITTHLELKNSQTKDSGVRKDVLSISDPTLTSQTQMNPITVKTSTQSITFSSTFSSIPTISPSDIHGNHNIKKERFNFASFDCGALFLASNPGSREGSAIIQNTKDRYMLNKCSAPNKWFEIEFCEEILVESIQLANYELFSSTFKDLKVFVNNKYPPSTKDPWLLLGKFTAKNVRGKQVKIYLHFEFF